MKNAIFFLFLAALPAVAADFVWLSDIHFDPLATPALVDKLAAAPVAQWADILAATPSKFAPYGRDTNWPLFSSVLQASAQTDPKAAFTIVTGDLLVHHFREQFDAIATAHDDAAFRSFVQKTVQFVALQLKQRSPGKPVFVALGNNDDTCGDYAIQPGGPFLEDTAQAVGDLAGLTNTDSYVKLGSYSVLNPAVKHQRIIVLNTVLLSPRYTDRCGQSGSEAGAQLLLWLSQELAYAKAHKEKVWLVYHIPPGIDAFGTTHPKTPGAITLLWKESAVKQVQTLFAQYPGVVTANLAGHVHVDDFRLFDNQVVIIAPPITPITGQNPTFRTVTFDSHSELKNESTYYLKGLTEEGHSWELEYDFAKEWHLKGLNFSTYSALFSKLGTTPEITNRWISIYSASHAASSLNLTTARSYFCTSGNISTQAYQSCVAQKENAHAQTTN